MITYLSVLALINSSLFTFCIIKGHMKFAVLYAALTVGLVATIAAKVSVL